MKKEEILFIRVMSVAAILAVMAVIIIIGPTSTLFKGIVDSINNNVVDMNSASGSIYNLYFYKGLDTVYTVLFSVALFSTFMAIVCILTRYKGAGVYANISCISLFLTAVYVVVSYFMQGNIVIHRIIAGFYLGNISDSNFETAHLIGTGKLICAIVVIVLAMLAFFLIKSSRINRISDYAALNKSGYYMSVMVILFVTVYIEWLRPVIIDKLCESNSVAYAALSFVTDYYFAGKWFLNIPLTAFITLGIVIMIILRGKFAKALPSKHARAVVSVVIPVVIILVRIVVYMFNPPSLFGYLTMDENVCDVAEMAFLPYMIMYLCDVVVAIVATYVSVTGILKFKNVGIALLLNIILGVVVAFGVHVLVSGAYVLGVIFIGVAVVDLIAVMYMLLCIIEAREKFYS